MLRKTLKERGSISGIVIDACDGMPSSSTYRQRFRGLVRAYALPVTAQTMTMSTCGSMESSGGDIRSLYNNY